MTPRVTEGKKIAGKRRGGRASAIIARAKVGGWKTSTSRVGLRQPGFNNNTFGKGVTLETTH
jgi:hypothetical protein